jgi:phosphatidylinositol phospholipase C, delta
MMLNEGMFAGEHVWVLKPPGYRSDPTEAIQYKTLDLKITVFAAQHIPMEEGQTQKNFHPYIKCELHVEKPDERESIDGGKQKEGEYKAKTTYSKGDNPDFGEKGQTLAFTSIEKVVEELSFVRSVLSPFLYFSSLRTIPLLQVWREPPSFNSLHRHTAFHTARLTQESGTSVLFPFQFIQLVCCT